MGMCAVSLPPSGLAATGVDEDPDILTLSLRLPPRTPALALMSFKTLRILCAQLSLPPSSVLVHRALGSAPIELLCARVLIRVCAHTHNFTEGMASHGPPGVLSGVPWPSGGPWGLAVPQQPGWLNVASLASSRGFWDPPGFASTET